MVSYIREICKKDVKKLPYKNKDDANKARSEWRKKRYDVLALNIRKDSPIPEALERMKEDLEIAPATYAQQALVVQLRKDGYLTEETDGDDAITILKRIGQIKE